MPSLTWLLLSKDPADKARARAISEFVKSALADGQRFATELGYAPLLQNVATKALAALGTLAASAVRESRALTGSHVPL